MRPVRTRDRGDLARFAIPALGALGVALILLLGVNYCAGWTADTANYLSAARNLVAGNGLVMWNGDPYPAGPLFPFLLAAAELLGIDAAGAARHLNAAAFGLTVFTTAAWLRRRLRSPLLAVWAGGACLLMPALATAAASVWTEIIFILFTMVSLSSLDRFLNSGKAKALLAAAAAAGAACLTREVGAILIGSGALILLLRNDGGTRARIRDAALWSVVSLAPYGAWIVRNLLVKGSPLGVWAPIEFSGLMSLHLATGELALWLFGPTGFEVLDGAFGLVTGIDLAGPATVAAIAAKSVLLAASVLGAGYALARYRPGFLRANRTTLTLAIAFAATYLLFLLVFRPLTGHPMDVRYLLPLFPPLLVAATLVLDGCLANRSFTNARVGRVVATAVMSLWMAQQAGATVGNIEWWMGRCWPSPESPESDVLRYLRANPLDGVIWSSEPWALYLHTDHGRLGTINDSLADQLANAKSVQSESVYVVLFDWSFRIRDYGYGVDDVGALPGVELVADLDDGVIYHRRAVIPASATEDRSAAEDRVVRAYFDVHVYEDALAYVREPCAGADVQAGFFLRVVPAAADRSATAPAQGADFNSLDFSFAERGVIADGRCLAVVTFDYPIARFHTGQSRPGYPPFWEVETAVRDLAPAP